MGGRYLGDGKSYFFIFLSFFRSLITVLYSLIIIIFMQEYSQELAAIT